MAELSNLPADEMGILPKVPLAMAMVSFDFSSTFWGLNVELFFDLCFTFHNLPRVASSTRWKLANF